LSWTNGYSGDIIEEEVGGALGFSFSLDGLRQVIAPAIGGFLLEQ
jgi:hypothetical protein